MEMMIQRALLLQNREDLLLNTYTQFDINYFVLYIHEIVFYTSTRKREVVLYKITGGKYYE